MTDVQQVAPQQVQQVPQQTAQPAAAVEVAPHVNPEIDNFDPSSFENWDKGSGNWFKWSSAAVGTQVVGLVTKFDPKAPDNLAKPTDPDPTTVHLRLMMRDGTEVDVGMSTYLVKALRSGYADRKIKVGETLLHIILEDITPPKQAGHSASYKCVPSYCNIGHPNYEPFRAMYPSFGDDAPAPTQTQQTAEVVQAAAQQVQQQQGVPVTQTPAPQQLVQPAPAAPTADPF